MRSQDYWIGYVQGFTDGEGHINVKQKLIEIVNTNEVLINHCSKGLSILGIHNRIYGPYRSLKGKVLRRTPLYRLRIYRRESVRKYCELVNSADPERVKELINTLAGPKYWERGIILGP